MVLVFAINLLLLIVSLSRSGVSGGLGTLQRESCETIKKSDIWIHLLINVLGTLLLGAQQLLHTVHVLTDHRPCTSITDLA